MEKKMYETPEMDVVLFEEEDIITASGCPLDSNIMDPSDCDWYNG